MQWSRILLVFLIPLMAISCSENREDHDDKMIFRYNQYSGISSLDPAFARIQGNIWAVNQIFNTLVELDDDLKPIPSIAKGWEISEEGRTYTFYLRKDVMFHSFNSELPSTLLRAQDVEFSLNRIRDPKLASPGRWIMKPVKSMEAPNDSMLVIHLHEPFPPFLSTMSMAYASIVSQAGVDFYGEDFGKSPVGSGPFQFQRWLRDEKLVLRKNPNYFEFDNEGDRLPYLDAISIRFLPDKQSEYLELLQGKIDMISGLDPSYIHDILTLEGDLNEKYVEQLEMKKGPYLNTEYLGINQENIQEEPHCLQDRRLRQAFTMSFDRSVMLKYLRRDMGNPAYNGLIPLGMNGRFSENEGNIYNPDSSKALVNLWMQENNGLKPKVTINTTSSYLDLCEFVQTALLSVGFEATVELMPSSLLREGMATSKLQVFRASWIADYPDAQNYLSLFYSGNFTPNGPNYTHFKNPLFDSLYSASLSISDDSLRYTVYQKLDSISSNHLPVIPLFYDQAVRFHQSGWVGLEPDPMNLLDLKRVYRK